MRTIEPVLFFIVFAFSISVPTVKQLIFTSFCQRDFSALKETCLANKKLNDKIQSLASKWIYIKSICSIVPALLTPFLFSYIASHQSPSKFFIYPLMGAFLDTIGYVIFSKVDAIKPFHMIPFSVAFEWFGGMSSFRVIMEYYLLLVYDNNKLIFRFVILGICNNLGSFFGGIIVTYVITYIDYTSALLISVLSISTCLLYTGFLQPLKMNPRPDIPRKEHIKLIGSSLISQLFSVKTDVILTLIAQFLITFSTYGTSDLKINYYLRSEYQVTPAQIGILQSATSIIEILGPFIAIPLMNRYAKTRMWILAAFCSICLPIHFLILAFAKSKNMIFLSIVFLVFTQFYNSFLGSIPKKLFSSNNMVFFLGISSSFMMFSMLIGSTLMNTIYQNTLDKFPGTPFILGAILSFAGGVLATIVIYRNFRVYKKLPETDEAFLTSENNEE